MVTWMTEELRAKQGIVNQLGDQQQQEAKGITYHPQISREKGKRWYYWSSEFKVTGERGGRGKLKTMGSQGRKIQPLGISPHETSRVGAGQGMDEKVKTSIDQQNWKIELSKDISHFHFILRSVIPGKSIYWSFQMALSLAPGNCLQQTSCK